MCAAMVGADPDALDRLAGSFDQQARLLDATAQRVRAQVQASPWRGGAANRFRADWDSTHMPRLRQTSSALRSSAKSLREQAADQRRASGVTNAAGSVSGGGAASKPPGLARWLGSLNAGAINANLVGLLDVLSGIESIGVDEALGKLRGTPIGEMLSNAGTGRFFNVVGKFASGAGAVFAVADLYEGVRDNDGLKWASGAIGVATAAVGAGVGPVVGAVAGTAAGAAAGAAAAPVVVAAGAASLYGSLMLPNSNDELDATLVRALKARFGHNLDPNNLTVEQANYISHRYEGGIFSVGLLNSLSDGVDYKMRWLGDPAEQAGTNFRDWLRGR